MSNRITPIKKTVYGFVIAAILVLVNSGVAITSLSKSSKVISKLATIQNIDERNEITRNLIQFQANANKKLIISSITSVAVILLTGTMIGRALIATEKKS
ncbi:hypothetical protein [Desulfobacula phenolica]|uniref:Uncharacterized protein n=1 Tax=Desulfobacula phenolica TaxID=90732 RepID=A0A1H2KI01_9BACT|nr:hypothetical protein [Desulfobacula phenolica]SDU68036.1 hypothetical protein SAMN04487931_1511 [Desulfobacula phenolica]